MLYVYLGCGCGISYYLGWWEYINTYTKLSYVRHVCCKCIYRKNEHPNEEKSFLCPHIKIQFFFSIKSNLIYYTTARAYSMIQQFIENNHLTLLCVYSIAYKKKWKTIPIDPWCNTHFYCTFPSTLPLCMNVYIFH